MVAHIKSLTVDTKKWLDEETFGQGVALCQIIPGAIAVNTASYAGYRARGVPGMLAAFAGFTLPAFLLMLALAALYAHNRSLPLLDSLFGGLEVIVVGIILHAAWIYGKRTLHRGADLVLAGSGAALLLIGLNPFAAIVILALAASLFLRDGSGPAPAPVACETNRDVFFITALIAAGLLLVRVAGKSLFDLAQVMMKIDLFAFGGGYTALTLMFHEAVESRHWLESKAFMDGVALGQITPGPILITAAFIGYLTGGLAGASVGTMAIFAPGFVLITAALPLVDRLRSNRFFQRAIRGTASCFTGFLLFTALKFAFAVPWDAKRFLILAASFSGLAAGADILFIVIAGAFASVILL
jgi:chromate transporter